MSARPRVVLDAEFGSDAGDALALALAARCPEIELLAALSVGREPRYRARIAARWLELAGRPDLPAHPGCPAPLRGEPAFDWYGHEGEGLLEPTDEPPLGAHAVDALRALLRGPEPLHLVALGPLTNLAAALILEPEGVAQIASLTAIGGPQPQAPLERSIGAEEPVWRDREACARVLSAGIPVRRISAADNLDLGWTARECQILERSPTPLARALGDAIRIWAPIWHRLRAQPGRGEARHAGEHAVSLHAALAVAALHDTALYQLEPASPDSKWIAGNGLCELQRLDRERLLSLLRESLQVETPSAARALG